MALSKHQKNAKQSESNLMSIEKFTWGYPNMYWAYPKIYQSRFCIPCHTRNPKEPGASEGWSGR